MISKELSATLGFAVREAKKRRHEYVSVEHILFAILYDKNGMEIIESCGGNVLNLRNALELFFSQRMVSIPEGNEYVLQQTMRFQRVIQRAVNHARSAEKEFVFVGDIPGFKKIDQLLRRHHRAVVFRLIGAGTDVRHQDYVISADQRRRWKVGDVAP